METFFEGLEKNEDIETLAQLTLVTLCNYVCASLCYFDGGLRHLALRMEFSGKKREGWKCLCNDFIRGIRQQEYKEI